MCKYGAWKKLQPEVVTSVVAILMLIGCGAGDDRNEFSEPAPIIMSVEEATASSRQFVGKRVIIEGQLGLEGQAAYYIITSVQERDDENAANSRIFLHFPKANPDSVRMERCLDKPTPATGYLENNDVLVIQFVTLLADAITLDANSCYQYFD